MRLRWWWFGCWLFVLQCKAVQGTFDPWKPEDDEEDEEFEAFEDDEGETVPDDGRDLEDADFATDEFA